MGFKVTNRVLLEVLEKGSSLVKVADYPLKDRVKLDKEFENATGKELYFEMINLNEIEITIKK